MWEVQIYLVIYLGLASVLLINETVALITSMSGTMIRTEPRRHMAYKNSYYRKYAYIELVLMVLDLGCQGFGIYSVFGPPVYKVYTDCQIISNFFSIPLLEFVAIWGIVTDLGFFTVVYFLIRFSRSRSKNNDVTNYMRLWQKRIEYLIAGASSNVDQGNKTVIVDVATELADYFKDLEVTLLITKG